MQKTHSDPQHRPELVERYSYGWCHGPAGDGQVFRLLAQVTGDPVWRSLADRCWHTVTHSGLPRRLRPGFWDNSGRCCGTAGVLALACDQQAEQGDGLPFADVLAGDLAARATVDTHGARWSDYEHRASPPVLAPRTGWAMETPGSSGNSCATRESAAGRSPATPLPGPTTRPQPSRPRLGPEPGRIAVGPPIGTRHASKICSMICNALIC
jgi:Lanthionine synthetase C-like protein